MNWISMSKKAAMAFAFGVCAAFATGNALATESGGGMYPNGAEGVMAGALPPPGLYYLNYLTHYAADRLNDGDGKRIPVDFHVNASANVSRFVYMTGYHLLGGNLGFYANIPLVHLSGTLVPTPGVNLSRTKSGLGDISFSPFLLAWHGKNWHTATAIEINAPTGQYNKDAAFNIGRNYWSFQPVVAGTVLTDNGFELSVKAMLDFNTENNDSNYQSGHEFHFDYATAYHWGSWTFGAQGYFYKQISNDEQNGVKVAPDGNQGQIFAVGPTIKYDYKNMSVELKYQKELLVQNRPEGDKYWLKLIWAF
ncbi:MAG: transporter [Desulfuromonadales bacterium]|nr:transporter [Desulfuromonadales bacterium]